MGSEKDLWLRKEPICLAEMTSGPTYTVNFPWASEITGTPTCAIYKDEGSTDLSSTYLSGSISTSGGALTLPQLVSLTYGTYILVLYASPNGQPDAWLLQIDVRRKNRRM